MMQHGAYEGLYHEGRSFSCGHGQSHHLPGIEIKDGCHIDLVFFEGKFGEIRYPDVVRILWIFQLQEVRVLDGNSLCFPPFPTSPAIRMQPKQTHHATYALAINMKLQSNPPRTVCRMLGQNLFNPDFEFPISYLFFRGIIKGGTGYTQRPGQECFVFRGLEFLQLFFWVAESRKVSSPTNSRSSLFCFCRRDTSVHDGAACAFDPSQPYTVVSWIPASLAAWDTGMPSSFILRMISAFTSWAMRCAFLLI